MSLTSSTSRTSKRIIAVFVLIAVATLCYSGLVDRLGGGRSNSSLSRMASKPSQDELFDHTGTPVSYDITTPPGTGCEEIVSRQQQLLIESYGPLLQGLRYVNMWGILSNTTNRGDNAIWTAQQILLASFGIETKMACRYMSQCDLKAYRETLEEHAPHSGIIIVGGGNFNDFYLEDHPERIRMVESFHDFPVRAFPQSIWMNNTQFIEWTKDAFSEHPDIQIGARDRPSYDWLTQNFGPSDQNDGMSTGVTTSLTPDIAFMFGNRPDFRTIPKHYDVLIMARNDEEISALQEGMPPKDHGVFEFGPHKVTWRKFDWEAQPTPALEDDEVGENAKMYLHAEEGFRILGRAEFVITDRLHGHIMSTIIGVPHVLVDSLLGKNLAYHNTWTVNCNCVRIGTNYEESINYARLFFEKAAAEGRWTSSVTD